MTFTVISVHILRRSLSDGWNDGLTDRREGADKRTYFHTSRCKGKKDKNKTEKEIKETESKENLTLSEVTVMTQFSLNDQ